jgi:hypothetical protein
MSVKNKTMNKLYTLTIGAILALSLTAKAVDFSSQALYNHNFKSERNTVGAEISASTNLFSDFVGQTSLELSQAYGLTTDGADSVGITTLAFRQNVDKLTLGAFKPYVAGELSSFYGQGQKENLALSPLVGESFSYKGVDLFASVAYDFSVQNRGDGLTARLGLNWKF